MIIGHYYKLKELPNGCLSSQYKWTVGKEYKILGFMGSCVCVTDDEGNETSIGQTRFEF